MFRKLSLKKIVGMTLAAGFLAAGASAQASVISGGIITPTITSGALPDSPAARVDANTPNSKFSGVVSISIEKNGAGYICSGTLVGKRQVISAGHCVDMDGNGTLIDINQPGNRVRVVFNSNGQYNAIMTAVGVSMDPDYKGFGVCPPGVNSFCVNDDVAVITLGADAPASAKIYKVAVNPLNAGTKIMMAGYGTTGNGIDGYTQGPAFNIKRSGENYVDLFDGDDEMGWGGKREVYYADFDGNGQDTFCNNYGACSPILANDREAGIGGGDSGGPSFVNMYGELMLVANNTFSGRFSGQVAGTFGTYFGGIIMSAHQDYLQQATGGDITFFVPEPGTFALFGLGALGLLGARRRSIKK